MATATGWDYIGPGIPSRRERLWVKEGRKCHWCAKPTRLNPFKQSGVFDPDAWDMATTEHVIPRCDGGTDQDDNLVSACRLCNNRRSHEHNCGLPDGSLLGNYKPGGGKMKNKPRVVLTGDEKKALVAGNYPPPSLLHTPPNSLDAIRGQRDQALTEITKLRADRDQWKALAEERQKQIQSMRWWRRLRVWLARSIMPN